jgi:hypothetical protein
MAVAAMDESALLDQLEQGWVDDEFAAIIAAEFGADPTTPPEPPTSNGSPWERSALPRRRSPGHAHPQDRLNTPVWGKQRSPPAPA